MVYLEGNSEDQIKLQVIKSLKRTPINIFVIDSSSLKPENLDFMTAALDDHHPQISIRTDIG